MTATRIESGIWRYAICMSTQIAVRIPDELARALDELVSKGRFQTKAEAIRAAIEAAVDGERRRAIGEAIAEGYRRVPADADSGLEKAMDARAHEMARDLDTEGSTGGEW